METYLDPNARVGPASSLCFDAARAKASPNSRVTALHAPHDAEDERTVVVALFVSRVDERIDVTGAREGDEGEDERREERRRAVVAHEVRSIDRSSRACDAILGGDARAEAADAAASRARDPRSTAPMNATTRVKRRRYVVSW